MLKTAMETKDILTIIGIIISTITLTFGISEYRKKRKQEQAQNFLAIINNLKNIARKEFPDIINSIWNDDISLRRIPYLEKTAFLLLLEEIGILVNSKILKEDIAIYLFGYWTRCCYESTNFIRNDNDDVVINYDDNYWVVFRDFAEKVILYERNNPRYDASRLSI